MRIVCVGEAMVELSRKGGRWALGHGGDTLNTAVHLARLGHSVSYFTALGGDPFSTRLRQDLEGEQLDLSLVLTHPSRHAGLYAITTDDRGERSFTYWRDASAVREMFNLPASGEKSGRAASCDLLYFSLISLAILQPAGREALLAIACEVRDRGGQVAFDANYRPALWSGPEEARAARDAAIALADVGLPTLDDEAVLSGAEKPEDVSAHWQSLGCRECVVKLGPDGCRLSDGTVVPPDRRLLPVDTSGAGDAFDAGYLAARLAGSEPARAAATGHRVACWTLARPGAIPPRDAHYPSLSE
jgi:2-dehydro-3-deoxygluconokinase